MKKSLIALAVLAVSGASFAQSSVSIYGIADVWFGSQKVTNGLTGVSQRQTLLDSAGVDDSRWGLKGSEDLGGGLKANFVFEQGFTVDNGVGAVGGGGLGDLDTAGQVFSREVSVGFSGAFGAVKLGKMATPFEEIYGMTNGVFDSALSPANYVFASNLHTERPGNSIYYQAPNFGGFTGAVSYSLGEDKYTVVGDDGESSIVSVALSYGAGPVAVQFGYQVEDYNVLDDKLKFASLGASYDFGMVVAKATIAEAKSGGDKAKEYQLGVDFPVSSALTLSASYAKSEDSNVGFEQTREGYGIGAAYTLSKRTFVYAGYTATKGDNFDAGDDKVKLLAVGVNHRF